MSGIRTPEAPAYRTPFVFRPGWRRDVLVVCDHASRALPPEFGDMGLDHERLRDHIAWDPGAAGVAHALAQALGCPLLLGGSSRLVVDLNRHPDSPHLVVVESGGHVIPGNLRVDDARRDHRIARYFEPYHEAIRHHLEGLQGEGITPTLLSIHSFTPTLWGLPRPWPAGLMWKQVEPWIPGLLAWFRERGIDIGDNQPYDGRDTLGFTLEHHALQQGLPHALFEIRQDELLLDEQQQRWGRTIAEALIETGVIGPATSA